MLFFLHSLSILQASGERALPSFLGDDCFDDGRLISDLASLIITYVLLQDGTPPRVAPEIHVHLLVEGMTYNVGQIIFFNSLAIARGEGVAGRC